mgnify:FL=1
MNNRLVTTAMILFVLLGATASQAKVEGKAECRFTPGDKSFLGHSDWVTHDVTYFTGRELDEMSGSHEFLQFEDALYALIWMDSHVVLVKTQHKLKGKAEAVAHLKAPFTGPGISIESGKKTGYVWEIKPVMGE